MLPRLHCGPPPGRVVREHDDGRERPQLERLLVDPV